MDAKLAKLLLTLLAGLILSACGGGGGGDSGGGTGPGHPSVIAAVAAEPAPASACSNGGITVKSGIDDNLNGILDDPGEVDLVQYVCNGAAGANGVNGTNGVPALVSIADEPAGANCAAGGKRVTSGPDTNASGILDPAEVTSTGFICNGANGTNGTNGSNGANSLLSITSEPVGANCAGGGLKVVSWLDTIANGVLDASETSFTNYVCNGPGTVVIQSITADPAVVRPGQTTTLSVSATDGAGSTLSFTWSGPGSFATPNAASTAWTAPATVGSYLVNVQVSNGPSTVTGFASILVSAAPSGPIVTNVSPTESRVGQEILVTGAGFGASQGASTVSIGGVSPASVTSWSEFQIRAIVPAGAGTGSVIVTVGGSPSSPGFIVLLWASADNVVISAAVGNQNGALLVADGSGGAIIVWQDFRSFPGLDISADIFAQRVNSSGVPLWTANGVAISTAPGDQTRTRLVADGSGGAIIVWQDNRNNAATGIDIFAQRVNGAGVPQWTANGVAISTATGTQANPQLVADVDRKSVV